MKTNIAHLNVVSGAILPSTYNPNDPADWVRAEADEVSRTLANLDQLVADAAAAEDRARQFRLHYEKIRDSTKAHLARLVAGVPDRS